MKKISVLAFFLFTCVLSTTAQTSKPASAALPRRLGVVNEYTIKHGMMAAFLQWVEKESKPLYVKAGAKEGYFFTNVYDSASRNVVTLVEVHDNFAAIRARNEAFAKNNSKEVLDAWNAKVREFVIDQRTYMIEFLPELSWMNPKLKSLPVYWVATERYIQPGHVKDYENYIKNDQLPLEKKADTNGRQLARLRYGGDGNHFFSFGFFNDLTELDPPSTIIQAAGGTEAIAKMQQKLMGVVRRSETRILRLRPECSILPASMAAAK